MKFEEKKEIRNGVEVKVIQCIYETEEEIQEAKLASKFWEENGCHCEEEHDTYYVPDGEDETCTKHHWRCMHCHGIVQIG